MTDELKPQEGAPEAEQKPAAQPPAPESKADWKDAEIEKARREAAKRRVENKELRAELDVIKPQLASIEPLKEQVSKLADLLEKAETARKQTELNTVRTNVAAKYGLPPELAKRIQGDTPEAMEEDAKALAAAIPQSKGGRLSPGNTNSQVSGKQQVE